MDLNQAHSYPEPTDYAGFLIWQAANKWEKHVNTTLKSIGLNQAEYFHLVSLAWLLNIQEEVTQIDLAKYTGAIPMNTSKILKKFEQKKLVSRREGKDSRSKALAITKTGMDVVISAVEKLGEADNKFFHQNHKNQFILYLKGLNKVVTN